MSSPRAPQAALEPATPAKLVRSLSLLDAVLLIMGGIIGSGIFLTAGRIALEVRRPALFILVWVVGGLITMLACFAFAELGAMYPQAGGQYIYLREAYGELVGFLFGWMNFAVGGPGTIAALAVGFAEYCGAMWPALGAHDVLLQMGRSTLTGANLLAITAVLLLTVANIFGVRRGATVQNIATWMKFAAIALFVGLGVAFGNGTWENFRSAMPDGHGPGLAAFGVALIAVFWAYDGWVYITWVAGEVKQPERNIPRALVIGVSLVALIYVAVNAAYLYALPITGIAAATGSGGNPPIAHAAATALFSSGAARWLAAMIAVSCFGAMGCAILSYARVYYAMAEDGLFFRKLAEVHPRWRTPAVSLMAQGAWACVLAVSGTYDQLFTYVIFMMVVSYVAGVLALFVLRRTRPDAPRPYRCTGYPWLPATYVIFGVIWAINAVVGQPKETLAGLLIVVAGIPGYLYWRRQMQTASSSNQPLVKTDEH
ncbi:MAG: APC family permease [Terriglobales bacterium]